MDLPLRKKKRIERRIQDNLINSLKELKTLSSHFLMIPTRDKSHPRISGSESELRTFSGGTIISNTKKTVELRAKKVKTRD
jgi:hypothetical protein